MAQVPDEIIKLIDQFLNELEANKIHINKAILFGSYATGNSTEWSDVDLALASDSFIGERFKDRELIRKIKLNVSNSIEAIPYRPEDFTGDDPFVRSIVNSGVNLRR